MRVNHGGAASSAVVPAIAWKVGCVHYGLELMALHGGEISVSSAGLGAGSEFTIRMPLLARQPTVHALEDVAQTHVVEASSL